MQTQDSPLVRQMSKDLSRVVGILSEVVDDVKDLKKGQLRLEKRMDALDQRMDGLDQRMDRMVHDVSEIRQAVMTDLDWDKEQDKRILRLETHVGLPKIVISSD